MKKTTLRRLAPVPFTKVRVSDAFWAPRMEANRRVTVPMQYRQCKDTGRIAAWTWKKGRPNEPHIFWDSDVAKWIEAAAYTLATHPDKRLEQKIDGAVDLMAAGQWTDGYLNSHYSRVEPGKRWTNLRDCHELYCAGHLMEGAVAYFQATGKRKFLDIICRYADHIARVFGPRKGQKRGYCGHPEIELALVKLHRATGNQRYLDLATFFINERGRQPSYYETEAKARGDAVRPPWFHGYDYCQSHKPLRKQSEVVGHAVRAMYVYSGMADVAAETGDPSLLAAMKRLWENVTRKRMHVTGGLGPTSRNEGFTFDYDLPNENAYDETCANIALVFWAHRMLHLDPDGRYADVMERALYNSVISGVSLTGDRFFYANPLAAHPGVDPHGGIHGKAYQYRRSEWFGCACCPPNLARLLASFGGYVYSQGNGQARVNLYVAGCGELAVAGRRVTIEQKTRYPWEGAVRLTIRPDEPFLFTLALRIPGWCRPASPGSYAEAGGATLKVNGRSVPVREEKGYARVRREWRKGDVVDVNMPMPVERIEAHPRVRQDAGRVALQRGPVVYCLEEVDNGTCLHDLILPRAVNLKAKFEPRLLGGVVVIAGKAQRRELATWKGDLYRRAGTPLEAVLIKAIPYAVWANRQPGEMVVWMRQG